LYSDLNYTNEIDNTTARSFFDNIGIGNYHYADIHQIENSCQNGYPAYITDERHPVKPYYIPFRSIAPKDCSNLLVPGKSMA